MFAQAPSASGEYPVILFAVSVASAYVVTPGRDYPADDPSQNERYWGFSKFYSPDPSRSVALMPRYNAHFVPVRYCGHVHCVTGKPLPLDTLFQAAVEGVDASEWRPACLRMRLMIFSRLQPRMSSLLRLRNRRCPLQWCGCVAHDQAPLAFAAANKKEPRASCALALSLHSK
jgi:hypothetical protein